MAESREVALFGVASDGGVEQWDGAKPPIGIMLRWFLRPGLGFPDYGFDLYRATVPDYMPLIWEQLADEMDDKTTHVHMDGQGGVVNMSCSIGFAFRGSGPATTLWIDPSERVVIEFPDPAWYLSVPPGWGLGGSGVQVEVFARGVRRDVRTLQDGGPTESWRTRGIDRIELTGEGGVHVIRYGLVHSPRHWDHVVHRCLPLTDPGYPCGPPHGQASDEEEARTRVPPGVDWASRYSSGFAALRDALRALVTGGSTALPPAAGAETPRTTLDAADAVNLALLDPHLARVLGMAYDDPVLLNGGEFAYRVVGTWQAEPVAVAFTSDDPLQDLSNAGITISGARVTAQRGRVAVTITHGRAIVGLAGAANALSLRLEGTPAIRYVAYDADGSEVGRGAWRAGLSAVQRDISAPGLVRIELLGTGTITLAGLVVMPVNIERSDLLPSVVATDPGPPVGPSWVDAVPEQPAGTAGPTRAALRWDVAAGGGVYSDGASVMFQVGAAQLSSDPAATQPAVPPFTRSRLLSEGRALVIPSHVLAADPLEPYYFDKPLEEGWRAWWVRGVDLFGRASAPAPPDVERIEDVAAPPPPVVLAAEYLQSGLTAQQASVRSRSSIARAWLAQPDAARGASDGVLVVWGWSPELHEQCPDVDGFSVHVRVPVSNSAAGPHEPEVVYDGVGWGPVRASVGPNPGRLTGNIVDADDRIAAVTVSTVSAVDDTTARCVTDISMVLAAGALVGTTLADNSATYTVVANSDGPASALIVQHPAGQVPAEGPFELRRGTSDMATVVTDIAEPALVASQTGTRIGGALVFDDGRAAVLGITGGTFLMKLERESATVAPSVPAPGGVAWYPAYAFVLPDTGFGPAPSDTVPVAYAQVTVRAVRRMTTRPVESVPAAPGTVSAVHAKPPDPPKLTKILSGDWCAEVAEPADWYGVSRFTLEWVATQHMRYVVYRALGDAVMRLHQAAHPSGGVTGLTFPDTSVPTGDDRRTIFAADLQALDTALASGVETAITQAYAGLHADAQQAIAGLPEVEASYVALNGVPEKISRYVDQLDGRSRAHWFYRVAAVTSAGIEGAKSPPTPPICCPDVVPPAAPIAYLALSKVGGVLVSWQASSDPDVRHYRLRRAARREAAADWRTMTDVATLVPPATTPGPGETVAVAGAASGLLEYEDSAPAAQEWLYRLVAVDRAGNESEPSQPLGARSLAPPPQPPVWVNATRDGNDIELRWQPATTTPDPRLACLVERRPTAGGFWTSASGWLPRGVYTYRDRPPEPAEAWTYRLQVRDHHDQVALNMPQIQVAAL